MTLAYENILEENTCYFCRMTGVTHTAPSDFAGYEFHCPYCGNYAITRHALINLHDGYDFRARGAAIAQEKKLKKQDGYSLEWYNIQAEDDASHFFIGDIPFFEKYPKDYLSKLDRILLNLARLVDSSPIIPINIDYHDFGIFYVIPPEEYYFTDLSSESPKQSVISLIVKTLEILRDLKWITFKTNQRELSSDWKAFIFLTIDGIKHLNELHSNLNNKNQAFVAMWFSTPTQYFNALSVAVKRAGYSIYRVDKDCYNGSIMNQIINEIKDSRFLIADLTCNATVGMRGGVYYEAGLADGLGMPLILTCCENIKNTQYIHFDLAQFNTIFWKIDDNGVIKAVGHENEDFSQYMYDWIIHSIGEGDNF